LGPNQIAIASKLAPIIKSLIFALFFICYPISKALDYFLGDHKDKVRFAKKDLKTLMNLHLSGADTHGEGLTAEEIRIINSTIDIRNTNVPRIMVPYDRVFKLKTSTQITPELIEKIQKRNYSKVPIFDSENICIGILKTKAFINAEKYLGKYIKDIKLSNFIVSVAQNTNLLEALRIMQEKKLGVVMVCDEIKNKNKSFLLRSRNDMLVENNTNSHALGFVFLKDIFEEIIKAEIEDQDVHIDSTIQPGVANQQTGRDIHTKEGREMQESKRTPLMKN